MQNNRSGEKYPLKLNKHGDVVGFDELVALPPNQQIGIHAFFGDVGQIADYSAWKGYEPNEFIERYLPFSLFIKIEGKEYRYNFSKEQVKSFIFNYIEKHKKGRTGPIFRND